jgi:hypothetical protein
MLDDPRTDTPPQGDWLGTPFLRFERHGPLARCIVDRPKKRNAMTPSMYFGVRYAINHVDADADLAGMLLTGTGDVFIPGGDLGGDNSDGWGDLPGLLFMDLVPFIVVDTRVASPAVVEEVFNLKLRLGMIGSSRCGHCLPPVG